MKAREATLSFLQAKQDASGILPSIAENGASLNRIVRLKTAQFASGPALADIKTRTARVKYATWPASPQQRLIVNWKYCISRRPTSAMEWCQNYFCSQGPVIITSSQRVWKCGSIRKGITQPIISPWQHAVIDVALACLFPKPAWLSGMRHFFWPVSKPAKLSDFCAQPVSQTGSRWRRNALELPHEWKRLAARGRAAQDKLRCRNLNFVKGRRCCSINLTADDDSACARWKAPRKSADTDSANYLESSSGSGM